MIVAEAELDLLGASEKVAIRLYAPTRAEGAPSWVCRFEIGPPMEYHLDVHGATSLLAIALALKGLSSVLYGSEEYEAGRLGFGGEFTGFLGIPATEYFQDIAPYPF